MLYYKSCIGSKNMTRFIISVFISIFAFFQVSVMAQPCTMYMVSSSDVSSEPEVSFSASEDFLFPVAIEYDDINEALKNSTSGEVICFRDGVYEAIRIINIQGGVNNITLKAENSEQVSIINDSYSGAGIYIYNSKNIVISDFIISGGLYGIYAKGTSDLTITNNSIYNVGQEGVIIKSGISMQSLSNFVIANNIIFDTGNGLSQYGEGIYIGDGNDNYNEIINHVTIENNNISNVMNEAIDIKINVNNIDIDSNIIKNTNLKFNGVITVATADRFGADSNISIRRNAIVGVVNRSGYRAIGIAVGQGNALISDNVIVEDGPKFAGVCLFSTFMNGDANTVTLEGNEVLTSGVGFVADCGHGGTGADALANVIEITP